MASSPAPPDRSGAICYLFGILYPVMYLATVHRNRDEFLRFHCFQCLLLFLIGIPLKFIPLPSETGRSILGLMFLVWLVSWIVCMFKASQGKMFRLPVIGALAERLERL